jgi:hypothetical protein
VSETAPAGDGNGPVPVRLRDRRRLIQQAILFLIFGYQQWRVGQRAKDAVDRWSSAPTAGPPKSPPPKP